MVCCRCPCSRARFACDLLTLPKQDLKGFTSKVETLTGSNADTGDSFPLVAGDTWWSFFGTWRTACLQRLLLGPQQLVINSNCWLRELGHGDNYGFVPHPDGYTLHFPGDDDTDMVRLDASALIK